MIHHYKDKHPIIDPSAYIAHDATIIGDVTIEEEASIYFKAVIRGDVNSTFIGKRVNVQDLSLIHQSPKYPVILHDNVTIGHQATLHGCTVHDNALIGMDSVLLDGSEVGEFALIGAGSLVSQNTKIPAYTLAYGRPARVVRELTEEEVAELKRITQSYVDKGKYYNSIPSLRFDHQNLKNG
ncbi:MAG TPA: gamma carbonic anhydrase family protein [Pseudogracilibacillus sp.]|nr:gamma carbonic anhydrase family protein [Pseudogracilibacillus sp.]